MNCRTLNKILSISVLLLLFVIASCGKTGGNDDGTGGGGNQDDPKNLDYKKIIKFDTSSQSADAIKMQSFDLNSKQVGSIPIELDLTTIKSYKGNYKVGVTFLDKGHVNTKELNALKFGFNDLGGPSTVVLNNEDDANKRKAILYFSPNSLAKATVNATGSAVFSVIFNVSYKNGSQIEQANCKANIIVTRRYIVIKKAQINNENIDVISNKKIKEGSPVNIKVEYYSDVKSYQLKDGLYEVADYQVEFGPSSGVYDAEIITKELHFKKDETSSSVIVNDLFYQPKWRDEVNQAKFLFKNLNTGEYAKDPNNVVASYQFFRCDESGDKQFYFINGLDDTRYNQTFHILFNNASTKAPIENFIVCGDGVGSGDGKYNYGLIDTSSISGYLRFGMDQTEEKTEINKDLDNINNYISDKSLLGYAFLKKDIKPEEYKNLSDLTAQLSYDLGGVYLKRIITLSAPNSVARVRWSDEQVSDISLSLDSTDPLVEIETKVIWNDTTAVKGNIAEVKFHGLKNVFCFVKNESDSCDINKPDLVIPVTKVTTDTQETSTIKVKIKPIAVIKSYDILIEGLLKDELSLEQGNFFPSIKDPDDKKKVSLTITSASANFYPCQHDTDGTCLGSKTQGNYIPDNNIFKVLKGNKKHFIIEISSSNDTGKSNGGTCKGSPALGDFYLRPFMYSVDSADFDDPNKGKMIAITDPRFKIYKLSTRLDDVESGIDTSDFDTTTGRKIIGHNSICFEGKNEQKAYCQTTQSGRLGDCRQFFLVEDNRTDGRLCSGANAGNSCITVIGVSNINSDKGVLSKYPARSWRYIEIDKVNEHNRNIKITGLRGTGDIGWGKCNMHAIPNSDTIFDAKNAIKILRAGQRAKDKLVVASNMTVYGAKNNYCSLGVIPYSSDTVLCNYPRLKYGDSLSVLDNDFQDLNFRFTGFNDDWNNNDKAIEIENYSAQLGYLYDQYDEKDAVKNYIDDYLQQSTFTFSLRLPVGDPSEDKCGAKEYDSSQCKSYPVETNPDPYNWEGGSSLYGRYKKICADYLPDLIVDVKEFKYHTYEATKRYDNYGNRNKDALVLTNLCGITGDDDTKSRCEFPDHRTSDIWTELLKNNFGPGTCVINKEDASNPRFDCAIDKIL
jgi:hypothetical protein